LHAVEQYPVFVQDISEDIFIITKIIVFFLLAWFKPPACSVQYYHVNFY